MVVVPFFRKIPPLLTTASGSGNGSGAVDHASCLSSWLLLLFVQVAVAFYVAIAVVYSSCTLVSSALPACPFSLTQLAPASLCSFVTSSLVSPISHSSGSALALAEQAITHTPQSAFAFVQHSGDSVRWYPPSKDRGKLLEPSFSMPASLFLSKAFQVSHEHLAFGNQANFDVVPYFFRSSTEHDAQDVTLTTLVTRNRFIVFKELVERYRGPISVTIHVSRNELGSSSSGSGSFLDALHGLYASTPLMSRYVDVHLVLSSSPIDRQFNTWRNVARLFARTDFVMMLDVDFVPCTDFRGRIRHIRGPVKELLQSGSAALVVPAFEFSTPAAGSDVSSFPRTKDALIDLYNASLISMFHASWAPGHNSTDYPRFLFHSPPGSVYKIGRESYSHAYEPYVIFKREGNRNFPPSLTWCDERFVGYGGNKAACLYEMYISGVDFYVLTDDFLIHRSHDYDEQARKLERRYNRRIYADFREEMCLRYLTFFRDAGQLENRKAQNVFHECKKVRGVSRLAAMLLGVSW